MIPISPKKTSASTAVSALKSRLANRRSSIRGSCTRCSIAMKARTSSVPATSRPIVRGDDQPHVVDCMSARTIAISPGTRVNAPGQSIRCAEATQPSGRERNTISSVNTPSGRLMRNTHLQLTSVKAPPISGPRERDTDDTPA